MAEVEQVSGDDQLAGFVDQWLCDLADQYDCGGSDGYGDHDGGQLAADIRKQYPDLVAKIEADPEDDWDELSEAIRDDGLDGWEISREGYGDDRYESYSYRLVTTRLIPVETSQGMKMNDDRIWPVLARVRINTCRACASDNSEEIAQSPGMFGFVAPPSVASGLLRSGGYVFQPARYLGLPHLDHVLCSHLAEQMGRTVWSLRVTLEQGDGCGVDQ
jgi:hypothetical protein